MANLGGLIVAYVASGTIWLFHQNFGNYLPGSEAILIAGTISLAVTGSSYLTFPRPSLIPLSPILSPMGIPSSISL